MYINNFTNIANEQRLKNLQLHKAGAKYWYWKKQTIVHLNQRLGLSHNMISEKYSIPYSTVRRIWIEKCNEDWKSDQRWQSIKWNTEYSHIILEYIHYFIRTIDSTFVAEDKKKKIKYDLGIQIELNDIRSVIKNRLNLKFKKWSPRPINIDQLKFSLIRTLHAIEFTSIWEDGTLFINIDEVLFSNKTKQEYSWIPKGRWGKIGNVLFSGSKSLITAITSKGDWFSIFLLWNNNSDVFISFMKKLLLWIKYDLNHDLKKTLIILDNLKVHRLKTTLNFLSQWEASFSFIPAYTPEIAPIELVFNILKKRFVKQNSSSGLKLYKKEAFREIREAFSSIDREEIQTCFVHSFKIINEHLKNGLEINEEIQEKS